MTTPEKIAAELKSSDRIVRAMANRTIQKKKQGHIECISAIRAIEDEHDFLGASNCVQVLCDVQDYLEPKAMMEQLGFFALAADDCMTFIDKRQMNRYIARHQAIIDTIDRILDTLHFE